MNQAQQKFMINKAASGQQLNSASAFLNLVIILKGSAWEYSPSNTKRKDIEGVSCSIILWLLKEANTSLWIHDWWRLLSHQKKTTSLLTACSQSRRPICSPAYSRFLSAITVFTVYPDKLKRSLFIVAYPWSLLQQRMVDCAWSTCYINRVWSLKDKKRAWIILYHTSGTFNISIWC